MKNEDRTMALYSYAESPIGCFVEKDTGNCFEYSLHNETVDIAQPQGRLWQNFPHKIWVGGKGVGGQRGWRYANVKKTVAYIIVDEDDGDPVIERWSLKSNIKYYIKGN